MAINLPFTAEGSVPRTVFDILRLEAGQGSLPKSNQLMGASLAAYAVGEAITQAFEHSIIGSLAYGVLTTAALAGLTYGIMRFMGQMERFTKTLTALALTGAVAAVVYTLMHVLFSQALPPPLPTEKLLKFLLFPVIVWNVFMFAFLFRNAKLRAIPAFAAATIYVLVIDMIMSPLLK